MSARLSLPFVALGLWAVALAGVLGAQAPITRAAAITFEADTVYTRALAALAHARLSRRNARDADSLLHMAELRRDVGDVSELDVRLAAVNAGQLENTAAGDSLSAVEALLELQLVMGDPAEEPTLTLADSLLPPPDSVSVPAGQPLRVAAAS